MKIEDLLAMCLMADMADDKDVNISFEDSDTLSLGAGRQKFIDLVAEKVAAHLGPMITEHFDKTVRRIRRTLSAKRKAVKPKTARVKHKK